MTEEIDDNQKLINPSNESDIKLDKNVLSYKMKIAIISIVSILVLVVIIIIIVLSLKSDDEKGDTSEDSIEVLPPIIIDPSLEYTHCIIWLHGWDSKPEDWINLFTKDVPFIKQNHTKIILMRAPYQNVTVFAKNFTSWFDILTWPINNTDSYNFTDATKSKKVVEKIIEKEVKKLNGKYDKIFIGGHSQGACISLYTGYNFKELLGGILVCSGVLFPQAEIIGDKNKLNVFLGHGTGDQAIPLSFHNETIKRIENFEGIKRYYYQGKGHDVHVLEKADMSEFLNDTMI